MNKILFGRNKVGQRGDAAAGEGSFCVAVACSNYVCMTSLQVLWLSEPEDPPASRVVEDGWMDGPNS